MDPHIWTFDREMHTLTTICNYSLVQMGRDYNPDFAVYTQFESCFAPGSCLSSITFMDNGNTSISSEVYGWMGNNMIDVNGAEYSLLDYPTPVTLDSTQFPVLAWSKTSKIRLFGSSKVAKRVEV
ncbi:uncharacterized protein LOC134764267 [Penaeus indicus]|uniref:uncharacterized protein LOC134764267 n=1 Tax=Penaeus indicus TaxID=29960 RepID=UPI00300C5FF1